jgi:hypothetical protein
MGKLIAVALAALALTGSAAAARGGCHQVAGTFVADQVVGPGCASFFCTHGALTGDLAGAYDFVATGIDPGTGDFLGHTTITLVNGAVLTSDDTSAIDFATGTFVTTISFVGGTRQYAHASGQIVAPGHFTATGTAGTYSGEVCLGR